MTVNPSVQVPAGVCGTGPTPFQQLGDGFGVSTVQASGNQPSFRVVATLDKAVVRKKPGNPGATSSTSASAPSSSTFSRRGRLYKPDVLEVVVDEERHMRHAQRRLLLGAPRELPEQGEELPHRARLGPLPRRPLEAEDQRRRRGHHLCVPYPWDEKGGFG